MSHTPGPWKNRHANQHGQLVINSPNWTSAATSDHMIRVECRRVHDEILGVHVPAESIDEAEANARLIAAAPEMLNWLIGFSYMDPDRIRQEGRMMEVLRQIQKDAERLARLATEGLPHANP